MSRVRSAGPVLGPAAESAVRDDLERCIRDLVDAAFQSFAAMGILEPTAGSPAGRHET